MGGLNLAAGTTSIWLSLCAKARRAIEEINRWQQHYFGATNKSAAL
jgi:hypothetical protein